MCVCVFICVCVSLCECVHMRERVCVCVCVHVCTCAHMHVVNSFVTTFSPGTFASDRSQWSWKDNSLSICGLDQWIDCLPSQGQNFQVQISILNVEFVVDKSLG